MYLSKNQQVLLTLLGAWVFLYILNLRFEIFSIPLDVFLIGALVLYGLGGFDTVNEWERRPVMFFGWYAWTAGPGIIWIPPLIFQTLANQSVRQESNDIVVEDARTKDNVPLRMVLVVTRRVDPKRIRDFIVNVKDGNKAVDSRAEASTVEVIGSENWEDIQHERTKFSDAVTRTLIAKIHDWGVTIIKVEIKNIVITDLRIAEAVANVAISTAQAQSEKILSTQLEDAAKRYGIPVYTLRQLVAAERMGAGPGNTMFATNILGEIGQKHPELLAGLAEISKNEPSTKSST